MQDKRSRIIRAQGEAKSAELIGAALAKVPCLIIYSSIGETSLILLAPADW